MSAEREIQGREIGLHEMLEAREQRVLRQQELLKEHNVALISFSMNIAGPIKRFPLAEQAFEEGCQEIDSRIRLKGWKPAATRRWAADTGLEMLWAVPAPPLELKMDLVMLENTHPLGRLWDIDIIGGDGNKIARQELDFPERACLICGEPGPGCARERAHSLDELFRKTVDTMRDYFHRRYAERVAQCAIKALLYEVCITPKPGLVDQNNNGAHKDMDLFTFINSTAALLPYFQDITLLAIAHRGQGPEALLQYLRYPGQKAEQQMLRATGGVNTHKGAVFSLGIVCAAIGLLYDAQGTAETEQILEQCGKIASAALTKDFGALPNRVLTTHGETLYHQYRITGIRGEAAAGFPSVSRWGLPILRREIKAGASLNDAGVTALLHLIAHVEDTNIISRSSIQRQKEVQQELQQRLLHVTDFHEAVGLAAQLDKTFIGENISPGGCADLLALSFLLLFWEEEQKQETGRQVG